MLQISHLAYSIGARTIFNDLSVQIDPQWRIGVVGANGTGKTTLFKLITQELQPDGGEVAFQGGCSHVCLRQDLPDVQTPLLDVVLALDESRAQLIHAAETETDAAHLAEIHARLNDLGAHAAPSRAAAILTGLGFTQQDLTRPFADFSGGWRMRAALAGALLPQVDFLLLDEPTNHLDLEAAIWLEDRLKRHGRGLLLISHDRRLLNRVCDHILFIEDGQAQLYTGNYDQCIRERALKREEQQSLFEKQQAQRAHMQRFVDRFRYKATKARQAQSRIKALERMDLVEAVLASRAARLDFPEPEELPPPLLSLHEAAVGYPPDPPVLYDLDLRLDQDDRIGLLGANGNGKSTLLRLIAGRLAPMAGTRNKAAKLRIGYFAQHQLEEMQENATPFELMRHARATAGLREEVQAVRAALARFGFNEAHIDRPVTSLSGGEKARLLLGLISCDAPHILLLDEPTNHLDMEMREALIQALGAYAGAVILVSHDPELLGRLADQLWLIEEGHLTVFDGDLADYEARILGSRKQGTPEAEDKAPATKPNRKEQRRQRARAQAERAPLRQTMECVEREVARLSEALATCETAMADPALYEDSNRSLEIQQQHTSLKQALQQAETHWLKAAEAWEQARGERERG